jgi:phosphotransferase system enzyme I (PtsI)
MYPMVSGIEELRQANIQLSLAQEELREQKMYFDDNMQVGTMIEVPSAAITADILAKECDFFSIGTNDLIQYSLAVDRVNEKIAHLYEPTHPAIIRLIHQVVHSAHQASIKVSLCGEMAGDIALTPILLGIGIDELSTSPPVVPQLKKIIRSLNISQTYELAEKIIHMESGAEIRELSTQLVRSVAPDVLEISGSN